MLKIIFNKLTRKNGIENANFSEQLIEEVQKDLIENLKFDIKYFTNLSEKEQENYLLNFKDITSSNIIVLADILFQMAKEDQTDSASKYAFAAIKTYNFCDKIEKSISFDRERKKGELKLLFRI